MVSTAREPTADRDSADSRQRPSLVIAVFVALFGAVVLPAYVIDWQTFAVDGSTVALVWATTAYAALALARIVYYGPGQITRLSFYLFLYVFMGLPVLAQITSDTYPLLLPTAGDFTAHEINRAYLSVVLGVASYEITSHVVRALRSRRDADTRTIPRPRWSISQERAVTLAWVGLALSAVFISRTGLRALFNSRQAAKNALLGQAADTKNFYVQGKAYTILLGDSARVSLLIALFAILYLRRHKQWAATGRGGRVGTHLLLPLLVVANIVVNNPIANSRFWFSTVAIALLSVYLPLQRATSMRWAALLALFVLLFAFTSLATFRRATGPRDTSVGFVGDFLTSGTYAEFEMQAMGTRYLEDHAHTQGRQLAGSIGSVVPRSLWPSKPEDTGNLVLPYANPAAPLWTEGQVDFGVLGVIVYFALLGAASAIADLRMLRAPPGSFVHAVVPIAAGYLIFVLRGSLQPAFTSAYFLAISLLFLHRRRRAAVSRTQRAGVVSDAR